MTVILNVEVICLSDREEMKKSYIIIIVFCAVIVLGVFLLWEMSVRNLAESYQPQQKNTVQQKEKEDLEEEEYPESEEDLQLMKRLREEDAQWMKQRPYIRKSTPEEQHANDHGAEAKITLRVLDSRGNPVEGATVIGGLYPKSESMAEIVNGVTDGSGLFSIAGKTRSFIDYVIQKEGYYPLEEGKYWVFRNISGELCFKDGRWVPWNPTIEVTLKEKRNPIAMYSKRIDCRIPRDEEIGFDCEIGDWVAPHGKGKYPDFMMEYTSRNDEWSDLDIQFSITAKENEGFIQVPLDSFSYFKSIYEAPLAGYERNLNLSMKRENHKTLADIRVPENQYLVFRTRVEMDGNGEMVKSRYGKIYEFIYDRSTTKRGMGYVRFTYYFNPNENDRNLEFGGNLFER